eukprot:5199022-Amphidinium_carterae.2
MVIWCHDFILCACPTVLARLLLTPKDPSVRLLRQKLSIREVAAPGPHRADSSVPHPSVLPASSIHGGNSRGSQLDSELLLPFLNLDQHECPQACTPSRAKRKVVSDLALPQYIPKKAKKSCSYQPLWVLRTKEARDRDFVYGLEEVECLA